jgi:hypothetical protein
VSFAIQNHFHFAIQLGEFVMGCIKILAPERTGQGIYANPDREISRLLRSPGSILVHH